jgi:hypothetical protein
MSFDVSATSPDMRESVHSFAGDEAITTEAYQSAIFAGYVSTVSTLYGVARGCNLPIDTATFERWKRFGAAAGLVDDYLDESGDIASANMMYYQGLHDIMQPTPEIEAPENHENLLTAALLLKHGVDELPETTKYRLLFLARTIGNIAVQKSSTSSIHEYIELLETEASLTSQLVTNTLSQQIHDHPGYSVFETWCNNALAFATLADSVRDLWSDAREGRTAVQPSLGNAFRIIVRLGSPLRKLYRPAAIRSASVHGVIERGKFSRLPTKWAMKKYQNYSSAHSTAFAIKHMPDRSLQ